MGRPAATKVRAAKKHSYPEGTRRRNQVKLKKKTDSKSKTINQSSNKIEEEFLALW